MSTSLPHSVSHVLNTQKLSPATSLKKVGSRPLPLFVKMHFVLALNELRKAELSLTGPPHSEDGKCLEVRLHAFSNSFEWLVKWSYSVYLTD